MKRYRLKKWVKVVITLILISLGIIIYGILGDLGSFMGENRLANVFILLGWFWLLVGQIMVLYVMWEK